MTVWLNGRLVADEAAFIAVADRGFTLGDGLFETLLVMEGVPRRFGRHWTRLSQGAALLGIPLSRSPEEIAAAIGLLAMDRPDCAARITLTRGPAPRGLRPPEALTPTWLISVGVLPDPAPARLILAAITRRNEHSPLVGVKSLGYLDHLLALQEALARGADDALLLNTAGHIVSATTANAFFVIEDRLVTPPLADGPLPGIARALLLEAGLADEQRLIPADLQQASAGMLTNSLGLRPIRTIEGRQLETAPAMLARARAILQTAGE